MVLQESDEIEEVKAPVPVCDPSVVVAITVARDESVPYAKPCSVASAPPVAVMLPLRVAVVAVTDEAAWVVTVGTMMSGVAAVEREGLYDPLMGTCTICPLMSQGVVGLGMGLVTIVGGRVVFAEDEHNWDAMTPRVMGPM